MIPVVYDTNIWIAWETSFGDAYACVKAIEAGKVAHFYCEAMIAEFADVLRRKTGYLEEVIWSYLYDYRRLGTKVEISGMLHTVAADPDDDKIVECASIAGVQYIVSRDHHLLDLGIYDGIQIVTPKQFLKIITP